VLFVNYLGLYLLMLIAVPAGLVMVAFEERELVGRFGEDYRKYQREVPRFIPHWRKTAASNHRNRTGRCHLDADSRGSLARSRRIRRRTS